MSIYSHMLGTACIGCVLVVHEAGATTVGAYYYPWWGESIPGGHTFDQTLRTHLTPVEQNPEAGRYSSRDQNTISNHIDQSHLGNISMWALSWWGPNSFTDLTIHDQILTHPRASELQYAIHYESTGRLGAISSPNYANLIPDFTYLAQEYFNNPNYLRIDGRPVVIVYLSRIYFDDPVGFNALQALRGAMIQQFGTDPYLIGDHLFRNVAAGASRLDAITGFDVYGQVFNDGIADIQSITDLAQIYANAKAVAASQGVSFVPGVSPGFNDKGVRDGHEPAARYLDHLGPSAPGSVMQYMLENAVLPNTDPQIDDLILINSFNEWHEDTQVEATVTAELTNTDDTTTGTDLTRGRYYEGYGNRYLNIIRTATLPGLIGDLDGDGHVGITDLNIVLGAWNQTVPPGNPLADQSGDGFVGIEDLNVVLGNWNAGTPPSETTNIPEPATLALTGLSMWALGPTRPTHVNNKSLMARLP